VDLLDLVIQAKGGNEQAFASLTVAVGGRLHAVSKRILRDADLAEDATQQAFITMWQELPKLRDAARFEAWAYRVLVRACYAEAKKKRRWAPNLHALTDSISADVEHFVSVWNRDQVERGFRQLSIEHRAALVLRYYLDQTPEEIAETLGVPVGTIRSRLFYGIRHMRATLDADDRPELREAAR
jgi:RNA polymerase sigma-70 factor (ECF subfamily)